MDNCVAEKLAEWNMEELVDTFRENQIDFQVFRSLTPDMIKELIPQVGLRFKFSNRHKDFIQNTTITSKEDIQDERDIHSSPFLASPGSSCSSVSAQEIISTSAVETYCPALGNLGEPLNKSTALYKLLKTDPRGFIVIETFTHCKRISRFQLADIIIDNELKDNHDRRISCKEFKDSAFDISLTFPGEFAESYYVPYAKTLDGKVVSAKGILWDKYVNRRRILRKIGVLKSTNKSTSRIGESSSQNTVDEDILDKVQWLKNHARPWDHVLEFWELTFEARKDFGTIDQYYNDFPALREPAGYTLLELDFDLKFLNNYTPFLTRWRDASKKIIHYAERKTDKSIKDFLGKYSTYKEYTEKQLEVFALLLLPLCIAPCAKKTKRTGVRYKPSKLEVQQAFCFHVEDIEQLSAELEERRRKLESLRETLQPTVVIVGTLSNISCCYLIVNTVRYKIETPPRAIDVAFKVFHTLTAKYPFEADHIWHFLQKYIYNITTEFDNSYTSISTFISDLNNLNN